MRFDFFVFSYSHGVIMEFLFSCFEILKHITKNVIVLCVLNLVFYGLQMSFLDLCVCFHVCGVIVSFDSVGC
jgi:hypothetical protein